MPFFPPSRVRNQVDQKRWRENGKVPKEVPLQLIFWYGEAKAASRARNKTHVSNYKKSKLFLNDENADRRMLEKIQCFNDQE